jgi:hypothetical protein
MTFDLRREQRTIDEYIDIDIPATRIRRMLRLVHVAAGYAFNKQYGEVNGFDFQLEGGSNEIEEDGSLMEIEAVIKSKSSIVHTYKMTCDNGNEKYGDLNLRIPRATFIENMMEFINSRQIKNKLHIREIKLHTLSGGKNPTLQIKSVYSYKELDAKGRVAPKSTNLNFNFSMKYAGSSTGSKKLESLKPKDVKPKITDTWLTPQEFYNNVISFINSTDFPSSNIILRKDYVDAITDSYRNTGLDDRLGIAPDLSSEFFEILSVLKLSKLLMNNNANIKHIIGWPEGESISSVEIYLPEAANEALIDYKIAVNGNKTTPLKISVKSKVRGSSTATVKFTTAFSNEAEVHKWFKSIISTARANQIGQRMIASSAMEYNKYSKKGTLYPIRALRKLFAGSKKSEVKKDFNSTLDTSSMKPEEWIKFITLLDNKITSVSKNYAPIDDIIIDTELLTKAKNFIADNLFKGNSTKTKILKQLISASVAEAEKKSPNRKYPFALNNVALLCERVLVKTSQQSGSSQFNFYKLFYEQVLAKESVVYSVTSEDTIGGEARLKYDFISTKNFSQYKQWIELRSKNYANNMQDALGMGV